MQQALSKSRGESADCRRGALCRTPEAGGGSRTPTRRELEAEEGCEYSCSFILVRNRESKDTAMLVSISQQEVPAAHGRCC